MIHHIQSHMMFLPFLPFHVRVLQLVKERLFEAVWSIYTEEICGPTRTIISYSYLTRNDRNIHNLLQELSVDFDD